jgi:phosphopantothenoylcysteine decarboxylase/phosphopantothenate--cysteine ligase
MLKGKKIVLGVTGSIAAYKIPILVRLLKKEEADVQVVMTPVATDFVTPLTLSTLSQHPVWIEPFDKVDGSWNSHVDLGNWADIMLLAPVSANTLGKMVNGIADNLLITTYLAAKCPVYFAPAMDLDMYKHPSTKRNIDVLQSYGNILIEPQEGELASGLCGAGRMEEPERIVAILKEGLKKKDKFKGVNVLVTAGPTFEAIDPVRFIGNHSSGLMGFSIADEFAAQGASVTLIAGPVHLKTKHSNVKRIDVVSALEMYETCVEHLKNADVIVKSAAVADFTPADPKKTKIKKKDSDYSIKLQPTKDILLEIGKQKTENQVLIGFALETNNELDHAKQKLKNKNLDCIVLNSLNDKGAGFGTSTNKVSFINKNGSIESFELMPKTEVASHLADHAFEILNAVKK